MAPVFLLLLITALMSSTCKGQRIQTVEVANSRYFISNASPFSPSLNWFLAYEYCRNIGMELLSLEQSEEVLELNAFLKDNNYAADYWTSGNQLGSAMWLWMSNGQPFNSTFNYWSAGGPPLTKSQQSCMSIQDGVWSPHNCMDAKSFICEQTRCFYYNYVTTNRASSQGNTTTTTKPGITRITNRPQRIRGSLRPITRVPSQSSQTSFQRVAGQEPQRPSLTQRKSTTETTGVPATSGSSTTTSIPDSTESTTLQQEEEVEEESTTPFPSQFTKIMTTTQTVKIMPTAPSDRTTDTVKVMPAVPPSINDPSIDATNNEIVPTDSNLALRLLQPPTNEFTPKVPQEGDNHRPNLMEILSRKETFSWALTDGAPERAAATV